MLLVQIDRTVVSGGFSHLCYVPGPGVGVVMIAESHILIHCSVHAHTFIRWGCDGGGTFPGVIL